MVRRRNGEGGARHETEEEGNVKGIGISAAADSTGEEASFEGRWGRGLGLLVRTETERVDVTPLYRLV